MPKTRQNFKVNGVHTRADKVHVSDLCFNKFTIRDANWFSDRYYRANFAQRLLRSSIYWPSCHLKAKIPIDVRKKFAHLLSFECFHCFLRK